MENAEIDTGQKFEFALKLDITADGEPINEKVHDVFNCIKRDSWDLEKHLHNVDKLHFVKISDVSMTKEAKILFHFEVKSSAALEEFYNVSKRREQSQQNKLSACITKYTTEGGAQMRVGYPLQTELLINICMPEKTYLKGKYSLCADDADSDDDDHEETPRVRNETENASSLKPQSKHFDCLTNKPEKDESPEHKPKVTKRFLVCVPQLEGKTLRYVSIVMSYPMKTTKTLENVYENIYGIDMEFSVDSIAHVTYWYEAKYTHSKYKLPFFGRDEILCTSELKSLIESNVIRDKWRGNCLESTYGHLRHIVLKCSHEHTLADICEQVAYLLDDPQQFIQISNEVSLLLKYAKQNKEIIAVTAIFANLRYKLKYYYGSIPHEIMQSQHIAERCLKALSTTSLTEMPKSWQAYMRVFCRSLSVSVLEDSFCPLGYISLCYDFLGEDSMLNYVDKCISNKITFSNSSTVMLELAVTFCKQLYSKHLEEREPKTETNKLILEKVLRYVPFKLSVHICQLLVKDESVVIEDPVESKLQDSIYASVVHQIIPTLNQEKKKRKDVQGILAHWVLINKIDQLRKKTTYKHQFEQAVIEVLCSTKINNMQNINEIIEEMCIKHGFFESADVQKELLVTISESLHMPVQLLMVQLSHVPQMGKALETADVSLLKSWLTNYLKRVNVESEEHLLRLVLEMYSNLMNISSLSHRMDVKKTVENEIHIFMEKMDIKSILGKLHTTEKICENHPDVETVLNNIVGKMLQKNFMSFKPDVLLYAICGTGCKLRVSSDVTAKAVCTLMDLHFGKDQGSVLGDFSEVLSYTDFWNIVFHIEGKENHMKTVSDNKTYVRVQACIDTVIRLLQSSDVTLEFIVKIRNDIQSAKRLLASRDISNTDFGNILKQLDKDYMLEKKKLATTLSVIKKIEEQPGIPDVTVIISEIKGIRELIEKSKITAKQMQSKKGVWGSLEELPKLCGNIELVVTSKLFWNVCMESVLEEFQKASISIRTVQESAIENVHYLNDDEIDLSLKSDESTSNAETVLKCINVEQVMELLRLLNDTGVSLYRKTWEALNETDNRPMSSILKLIQNVNMADEIEIAGKVMKLYLKTNVRRTLNRIGKRKTQFRNVEIVKAFLKTVSLYEYLDQDTLQQLEASNKILKGDLSQYTFKQMESVLQILFKITDMLSEDSLEIMAVISRSSELLKFLHSTVEDEFSDLIDAVEDISEQEVNATTVSSLIEVKRVLHPLLVYLRGTEKNATHFLEKVEKEITAQGKNARYIPSKIRECADKINNLKTLYNNVANRGEQTKESIANMVKKGIVFFLLDIRDDKVYFEVTYTPKKQVEVTKDESTLSDLRSRALLLMNSEWSSFHSNLNKGELRFFVDTMDICASIRDILQNLHISGHLNFVIIRSMHQFKDLQAQKEYLLTVYSQWISMLDRQRDKYYLLNFVRGFEMQILCNFLDGNAAESAVDTILKYIHPHINPGHLREVYEQVRITESQTSHLPRLGQALHLAHTGLALFQRPVDQNGNISMGLADRVQNGKLLLAKLEEDSLFVVQTLLTLFINTTHRLPEPNQVIFCSSDTKWSDIQLLLRRCTGSYAFYKAHALFCIANAELLSNHMQSKLVGALQNLNCESDLLLAVICRGTNHHPFIEELEQYVTVVQCLSSQTISELLRDHFPGVCTYFSDVSGQGKTTEIYRDARLNGQGKGVKTLHISDPFDRKQLLKRLEQMRIDEFYVLHIDIYSTRQQADVDIFLFELIMLRFIDDGKTAVFMPHSNVAVEISNTIRDRLRNSLHTVLMFKRKSLKWENFENFVVSKELNSAVQVACHYLNLLEQGQLDTRDVCLGGESNVMPLSARKCQQLLRMYVNASCDMSFTVVNTFINVLADQLKKMSSSAFFRVSSILDMVGDTTVPTVRSLLVKEMVHVSLEFAFRSVSTCRNLQNETSTHVRGTENESESPILNRMDGMIRWDESNHLIYVFHNQNIQTLSAMYRHLEKVPVQVSNLFEHQMSKKLPDFKTMNQTELQNVLQKIVRSNPQNSPQEKLVSLANDYALTPDNLLKMVLIVMRAKSKVPVILMGETGCGKTSLIRYLGNICDVQLHVVNIHPGIDTDTITGVTLDISKKCLEDLWCEHWLFFDEINTSDHLGLICDVLCHRRCIGFQLPPNLIVMGACNPYQLRSNDTIFTAGLDSKLKSDELSRLVYRVHPLPEAIVDYVWDFGSLSEKDEQKYVDTMLAGVFQGAHDHRLFCDLVCASQAFVRSEESAVYVVSLRDVLRCKILVHWFFSTYLSTDRSKRKTSSKRYLSKSNLAMILTLAHCYHCRFSDKEIRLKYRKRLSEIFFKHNGKALSEQKIHEVIKSEQQLLVDRMELPPGTAKNTALQENVFVLLVCILNKIPVFVVGKPGCSKSLAMQVIRSSVRGKDSKDSFLKILPQLLCVSFQGSESSTSDGISKVFEKAEAYQNANSQDVLSVVLLDEIGLAELSRFNPLKVLHNLLEPTGIGIPNISVVGISNWALDAAKMNRAIYLSRPDLDQDELFDTAVSISESFLGAGNNDDFTDVAEKFCLTTKDVKRDLKDIAHSYADYSKHLRFENFHGLRDFYSLVKYVAPRLLKTTKDKYGLAKVPIIRKGLERNFGGLPSERNLLYKCFSSCLSKSSERCSSVIELIAENISDPLARHVMIITEGDSVVSSVEHLLKNADEKRWEQLVGSKFEEDQSDAYNYRILSKIILCMEQGMVLVLKDLENIYGSMYDMLNQNYTIISKKKNCRIALGAYSNPFCEVADAFRCLVLVDSSQIDYSDPPFLNRFEKQHLSYDDVLTPKQAALVERVESWVKQFSEIEGKSFLPKDSFPNYSKELIVSLVLLVCEKESQDMERAFEKCKRRLLWIIRPEAVIRLSRCLSQTIREQAERILSEYFVLPLHAGMHKLIKYQNDRLVHKKKHRQLTIVLTNSNSYAKEVQGTSILKSQFERLSAFKSEKQLSARIKHFWTNLDKRVLFLHCSSKSDIKHIFLTMSIIEKYMLDFENNEITSEPKLVYLILHLEKSGMASSSITCSHINYLSGWKLVTMDSLEIQNLPLSDICSKTVLETIHLKRPLHKYILQELFWSFSKIQYSCSGRNIGSIERVLKKMKSDEFLNVFDERLWAELEHRHDDYEIEKWQETIACDEHVLYTSQSYMDALEKHILNLIKIPLAQLIYRLETLGTIESFFIEDQHTEIRKLLWQSLFRERKIVKVEYIQSSSGPESYKCDTTDLHLEYPFSRLIYETIEYERDDFLGNFKTLRSKEECVDENGELFEDIFQELVQQQVDRLSHILQNFPFEDYDTLTDSYLSDFCYMTSKTFHSSSQNDESVVSIKWVITQKAKLESNFPLERFVRIHSTYWINEQLTKSLMYLQELCLNVFPDQNFLSDACQNHRHEETSFSFNTEDTYDISGNTSLEKESETKSQVPYYNAETAFTAMKHKSISKSEESLNQGMPPLMSDRRSNSAGKIYRSSSCPDVSKTDLLPGVENKRIDEPLEHDTSQAPAAIERSIPSDLEKRQIPLPLMKDIVSMNDPFDRYVSCICYNCLPTSENLAKFGDVPSWQSRIRNILKLASEVSRIPPLLHALWFCDDIADCTIIPLSLDGVYLAQIANCIEHNELDSDEVFASVMVLVEKALQKKEERRIQVLLSQYLFRCFYFDPCTESYVRVFSLILESRLPEKDVELLKSPLYCILQQEIEDDNELGMKLLFFSDEKETENETEFDGVQGIFFRYLNNFLKALADRSLKCHKFVSLTVDLLQNIIFEKETSEAENEKLILTSGEIIRNGCFGLPFISAVACFKAKINIFGATFENDIRGYESTVININAVLTGVKGTKVGETMVAYVLKTLGKNSRLRSLMMKSQSWQEDLTIFKEVRWTQNYFQNSLEENPLSDFVPEHTQKAMQLMEAQTEKEFKSQMNTLATLAHHSGCSTLLLYSMSARTFYFPRFFQSQTDTTIALGDLFLENFLQTMDSSHKQIFLKCLIGKEDFRCKELMPTDNRTNQHYFISTVLVTVYALGLTKSHFKQSHMPLLPKCILSAVEVSSCFLPGFPDNADVLELGGNNQPTGTVKFATCRCGQRIAFHTKMQEYRCATCNTNVTVTLQEPSLQSSMKEIKSHKGYVHCKQMTDIHWSVRSLSSVCCNVLYLLIKGCVYGSLALGINKPEDIRTRLNLPENVQIWDEITQHWTNLKQMLNIEDSQLHVLLHAIILECIDCLFNEQNSFATPRDRNIWETSFEYKLKHIVTGKFKIIATQIRKSDSLFQVQPAFLEQRLLEADVQSTPEIMNENMAVLFRMTSSPTKNDFITQLQMEASSFHFLRLAIQKEKQLSLPVYIFDIIQWHMIAVATINFSMRSDEYVGLSVQDTFGRIKDENKRQMLRKRFKEFKKTWTILKEQFDSLGEMPDIEDIHMKSDLSKSLLSDESSQTTVVLSALMKIQNDFIDSVLSAPQNADLHFFSKGNDCFSVRCVPVTDTRPNQLIHMDFDWSEVFANECQCCLTYGEGQHVKYDFSRIERGLASHLLHEKCYLNVDSFPKIVFIDELYKNYGVLVNEIRQSVKQEPLPNELITSLTRKSEENMSLPSELLYHVDMIMSLLKGTRCKPNQPLIDFVEERKHILGRTLPEKYLPSPERAVQLCHIVTLHEALEELYADNTLDALEEDFCQPLDSRSDRLFRSVSEANIQHASYILKATKRFVYRCLSMRVADPDQDLAKFLADESFWPEGYITDGVFKGGDIDETVFDLFPNRILVSHARAIIHCLQGNMEVTESSYSRSQAVHIESIRPKGLQDKNERRRRLINKQPKMRF